MQCGIFHTPYNRPTRTPREMFDWSMQLAVETDQAGFTIS